MYTQVSSVTSMLKKQIPLLAAFAVGAIVTMTISIAFAVGTEINACVNNLTGAVRIPASGNCNIFESGLTWNTGGPQGPAGPQGVQGEPGPAGVGGYIDLNFDGKSLYQIDFTYRNLQSASMKNVSIAGGYAVYADLSDADMSNSTFSVRFDDANLSSANLTGSILFRSQFNRTNLSNADLTGADLQSTSGLDTANVTGVIWSNTICVDGTNSDNNGGTCEGHLAF